jgi:hypothetical protein
MLRACRNVILGGRSYKNEIVIILTLGTGIGSAFSARELFPNTELGHLKIRGKYAEKELGCSQTEERSALEGMGRIAPRIHDREDFYSVRMSSLSAGCHKNHERFFPF